MKERLPKVTKGSIFDGMFFLGSGIFSSSIDLFGRVALGASSGNSVVAVIFERTRPILEPATTNGDFRS